jgi:hypothetical protein
MLKVVRIPLRLKKDRCDQEARKDKEQIDSPFANSQNGHGDPRWKTRWVEFFRKSVECDQENRQPTNAI